MYEMPDDDDDDDEEEEDVNDKRYDHVGDHVTYI